MSHDHQDITQLAQNIIEKAQQKTVMIALAESCTGGMIAAALTDISGSSAVLDRGFVTYSNQAKIDILGVKQRHTGTTWRCIRTNRTSNG